MVWVERQARRVNEVIVCHSDNVQRVSVLTRDMDFYLSPRKVGIPELSPQIFRQCWQVSTLCVGVTAQHYVSATRHSRQYFVLQSNAVSYANARSLDR